MLILHRRKLAVWPGVEGDGGIQSTTPYKSAGLQRSTEKLDRILSSLDQKELPAVSVSFSFRCIEKW